MDTVRRVRLALLAFAGVIVAGTVGYLLLGFSLLEALYQTVTTVATVGFREVHPLSSTGQVFTIVLILAGVGTALYAFSVLLEALVEGHLRTHLEDRRMTRDIERMSGHVIICGYGRVGRACATYLDAIGQNFVVIDEIEETLADVEYSQVVGDVTDDEVLKRAGIERAGSLIAALDTDSDNVYVVLSARAMRKDLVIIARARDEGSRAKLQRAGADWAVNPQLIGGRRMATFALQRHVAEFVDVVMHDESLDYRMEQIEIGPGSALDGSTVHEAPIGSEKGALLLAVREKDDGEFLANPEASTKLAAGSIMIVVGTTDQVQDLRKQAAGRD